LGAEATDPSGEGVAPFGAEVAGVDGDSDPQPLATIIDRAATRIRRVAGDHGRMRMPSESFALARAPGRQ